MTRPDSVTQEDIARWDENLSTDPNIPKVFVNNPVTKEVGRAGLYLAEELDKRNCPDALITSIQFTCGRMSFGRDPWDMATLLLKAYDEGTLEIADDSETLS
jgi:hypothetical protein